jgi:hypothetical protein
MTVFIQLAEPYAPRPIRCVDILDVDGWRMKLYGIAYRAERPAQALVDAAAALAQEFVPRPAVAADRYGVGFVCAHDGRGGNFVFVDWWAGENELHHNTWRSTKEEPEALRPTAPDDFTACAWDLAVIGHERNAWVRHVLAGPDGPNVEAYVDDRLDGRV